MVKRELLSYEIAEKCGFSDVVAQITKSNRYTDYRKDTTIRSEYISFDPVLKDEAVFVGDYPNNQFDQLSLEKALAFTFLTFQLDSHDHNVLVQKRH